MKNSKVETESFQQFLIQLSIFYSKHNNIAYHQALDVDVEDICDYFLFVINEENRVKRDKMLKAFEGI